MSNEYISYLRTLASHDGEVGRRAQEELQKATATIEVPAGHTAADVMRHDKGHDDWHAAHGDPPCKDEADCARMRAKYKDDDGSESVEKSKDDKTDYGSIISNRKGEPKDQALYEKVIADAKKKFDVYPSAVANGWVVQEYKRRGGKYSKSVKKAASSSKKSGSYTPPEAVQNAAKRAKEWIAAGKAGGGFTSVGRKRANDLASGTSVSFKTVKRMKAYFDRHQSDKDATGFSSGEEGFPSPGRVAWDAWGGDAGYSWAKGIVGDAKKQDATVQKREFSADERQALADKGHAMPDGSYPITDTESLKDAIQAYGRASDKPGVKRHIKNRAKALGRTDLIPDKWKKNAKVVKELKQMAKSDPSRAAAIETLIEKFR